MQPKVSYQKITWELTVRNFKKIFFEFFWNFYWIKNDKIQTMVMVQKIAGHEPARKIGDMRVTGKIIYILGSTDGLTHCRSVSSYLGGLDKITLRWNRWNAGHSNLRKRFQSGMILSKMSPNYWFKTVMVKVIRISCNRTFYKINKAAIMFGQHYCHDRDGDSALKLHHQKLPVSKNR